MPCARRVLIFQETGVFFRTKQVCNCRLRPDLCARNAAERFTRQLNLRASRSAPCRHNENIHDVCPKTARDYGAPGDYVLGANISSFAALLKRSRNLLTRAPLARGHDAVGRTANDPYRD
jgi:glutamate dehydrogenase (NADP+)